MLKISAAATALILFSGSGVSAQSFAEFPGQVVRDALAAADCPQTDVTTFGVRPATAKHRECLYVALAAVGCARGNVDLCFQSLWDEMPPRRDPGAPRPLVEPPYWTDERVARLFAGYLPGTPIPETVRATPQVASAYLQANRPPTPPPDSVAALANIMIPFPNDPPPLVGSLVFAETYGMELVPQAQGGWRVGRIAMGSAAWHQDAYTTGLRVPHIAFHTMAGPRNAAEFPQCSDDPCLASALETMVVGDVVWVGPGSLDIGRPPPPGAPWIQLHPHVPKRMLNERFAQQVAYARTGMMIEGGQGVPLRVIHVAQRSPADAVGIRPGDVVSTATGLPNYLGSTVHQVANQLSAEGPINITIIRDAERLDLGIDRSPGGVVFKDNIATVDASFVPAATPNPVAARDAVQQQLAQEARAARPFGDFHPDLAAVLQLIYDGQHREARALRRTYTIRRGQNPMITLIDVQLAPVYALYQSRAWSDLPVEYGFVRSEFLGNCGDVVPRFYEEITTRNGVEVGTRRNHTMYFLRGLSNRLAASLDQTRQMRVLMGIEPDGRGWLSFFQAFPCGSPVIERLDREMVAFAGRG